MSRNTANKRKADWIASSFGDFGNDFSTNHKSKPVHVIDLTDETDDFKKYSSQDVKPWVEKYKPLSELDLAVHKKKIQDAKQILQSYFRDGVAKGSHMSGHYTALTKYKEMWFRCDDSIVRKVGVAEALMEASSGYIFVYKKR